MARDVRALDRQGLVERKEVAADRTGRHIRAVTLTPAGPALVERHASASRFSKDGDRPVHSGWGKPRELAHDASLYRMYLAEEQRILNEGGLVRAVLLDDELKHRLYESLDEWRDDTRDANQFRLLELARAEDIPIVDDHLQFPDLRIEYDTASGARTKVDLELTTEHYRGRQVSAKRQAGFTMYGAHGRSLAGTSSGGGAASVNPDFLSGTSPYERPCPHHRPGTAGLLPSPGPVPLPGLAPQRVLPPASVRRLLRDRGRGVHDRFRPGTRASASGRLRALRPVCPARPRVLRPPVRRDRRAP